MFYVFLIFYVTRAMRGKLCTSLTGFLQYTISVEQCVCMCTHMNACTGMRASTFVSEHEQMHMCMHVFHSFYIFEFFVHCKRFRLTLSTITMYVVCVCVCVCVCVGGGGIVNQMLTRLLATAKCTGVCCPVCCLNEHASL